MRRKTFSPFFDGSGFDLLRAAPERQRFFSDSTKEDLAENVDGVDSQGTKRKVSQERSASILFMIGDDRSRNTRQRDHLIKVRARKDAIDRPTSSSNPLPRFC
jgi:hypothetical protein